MYQNKLSGKQLVELASSSPSPTARVTFLKNAAVIKTKALREIGNQQNNCRS
jgi:hypothetical protein